VVVTGASSGIGEATARALAAAGHPVVLAARRVERCQSTADEIEEAGGEAVALRLDVVDPASVKDFVAAVEAAVGGVEVLVSNAGDSLPTTVAGTDPDVFADQVAVNLLAAQRLVAAFVPPMIERGRGDVLFVTSDVTRAPRPSLAPYTSAKWGLEGMARVMQMELEGTGVRASIVRPGPTATEMGWQWDPAKLATAMQEWTRWGLMRHDHWLRPEDVAAAVVATVSMPRGAHVTLIEVEPEAPVQEQEGTS
jgi:NADP-dependent 3-hydroxy acid dehydrogenase YdfG